MFSLLTEYPIHFFQVYYFFFKAKETKQEKRTNYTLKLSSNRVYGEQDYDGATRRKLGHNCHKSTHNFF